MAQAVLDTTELTLDNLLEHPEGGRLMTCIQCGICAGTCPYGDVMVHTPRKLIAKLRAGMIDEVLSGDDLHGRSAGVQDGGRRASGCGGDEGQGEREGKAFHGASGSKRKPRR